MNISAFSATNNPVPADYRLRMPGPAAIPERVRAATALPILSHRGAEFRAILDEVTQALRALLGTRAHVFLLGVSGSGGMEAALVNVLSAGDARARSSRTGSSASASRRSPKGSRWRSTGW